MAFRIVEKKAAKKRQLNLLCSEEESDRIHSAAKKAGVTMAEFVRQAIFYALDNMDD